MKKRILFYSLFIIGLNFYSPVSFAASTSPDKTILLDPPFTTQSPFTHWDDPRQQDGCEEASVLMAVKWARGQKLTKKTAEKEILAMADWEEKKYASYHDTAAIDTATRLIGEYYGYKNYVVKNDVSISNIVAELRLNHLVIVPANGQKLKNPNFKRPGPERHNLVIRGYDPINREFITNDPGTRKGDGYRYPEKVLFNAIRDYPTGNHLPIKGNIKVMIVVSKN